MSRSSFKSKFRRGANDASAACCAQQNSLHDLLIADDPPILPSLTAVQYLGMAFHELATNTAKYGALAKSDGGLR